MENQSSVPGTATGGGNPTCVAAGTCSGRIFAAGATDTRGGGQARIGPELLPTLRRPADLRRRHGQARLVARDGQSAPSCLVSRWVTEECQRPAMRIGRTFSFTAVLRTAGGHGLQRPASAGPLRLASLLIAPTRRAKPRRFRRNLLASGLAVP